MEGLLYWITGLSGAGKTSIGNKLYYEIKKTRENVVILDGDILKNIISQNPGYTLEERKERAYQYARLCKSLTDQGMIVICCTIAMYEEVRKWNRQQNSRYVEVFVDTPYEVLERRNQKGMYSGFKNGRIKNIVGGDIKTEFPQHPDIVIINDENNNLDDSVKIILNYEPVSINNSLRDRDYWNKFYASERALKAPSNFAKTVLDYMEKGKQLLELGCGNGRDSIFFAQNGINVTSVDESDVAIDSLSEYAKANELPLWCVCDDFVNLSMIKTMQYDYIYSRFTLHAISEKQETELLRNIGKALKNGGRLFVEARSVNDELFGKGEYVGNNAYIYDGHYRRFLEIERLAERIRDLSKLKVLYKDEKTGFAPSGNSDPPIIRIIAEKIEKE